MHWGASEKEEGEAAAVGEWASAPTLAPVSWKEREERRKAWQEERGCLLCSSEKTWASPRAGPWGAPGKDDLLEEPLGRNKLASYCLQVPSLPENHWGGDHGFGWRL